MQIRELGQPGDLGWVVMAHGEVYRREFGFDESFEAFTARYVAGFASKQDAGGGAAWIATDDDGRRLGCAFCLPGDEPDTVVLRCLLVHPDARGLGLGGRLLDTAVEFGRTAGFRRLKLWTNDPLVTAQGMYAGRGFTLTRKRPHRAFGLDLVELHYELELDDE
ncbi:acetyltransferase (GNAT) family protein [Kribbella voronezhensis]|uniref:Acetyltransferase (GNAT) family protein n=1 Tax=Kribbella voronezhensis TaxID=2512212 RepID=A0A4R7T5Z6_9ACTN|nr:GNAT family N-acetyltransferase [Kribbella voronezhensis]TDU87290.1 acetyltransferase (GNAT) family protein [Kribbella voronezhensis]